MVVKIYKCRKCKYSEEVPLDTSRPCPKCGNKLVYQYEPVKAPPGEWTSSGSNVQNVTFKNEDIK